MRRTRTETAQAWIFLQPERVKTTIAAALLVLVAGCEKQNAVGGLTDGGELDAPGIDARPDARPDAHVDDAGLDAGHDAAVDAHPSPDASVDAALDAGIDAPPDAPVSHAVVQLDPDGTGIGGTQFADGAPDPNGPYFTSLGTNGRSCASCHDRAAGWSITPAGMQARFDATGGTDPVFRPVDGAVSPNADVSTVDARRTAYAMLLSKGVIRVGLPIPAGAEFTLVAVDDPYGFASASELSLFRRPVPSTNLTFASTIMWDGRESTLAGQATDATMGHAQATSADPAQMSAIAAFESSLATAQAIDNLAGDLSLDDATGGPAAVAAQPFYAGINDSLGRDPTGAAFDPAVFTMYAPWAGLTGSDAQTQRRLSIARGEAIFNTRTFAITGVPGIPDQTHGTCSSCHDTPGLGGRSVNEPIALGLDNASHRTADMPLYTLQRTSDGATVQTTDPGRALITGKWADIGKFRVPTLRGLAMRAPYFHNGLGTTLQSVVGFYNGRFGIGLSAQDKADLVAFLSAL